MPSVKRLSCLDASFLSVESPAAHMHVGWAATFLPREGWERPSFAELREHIRARLPRAPRFRQRLREVPLGITPPFWVDEEGFDIERHVVPAATDELGEIVEECMSEQLPRDRPLWQICIADRLRDGRVGIVGKAHHSMVDGIAAVELASLLLDPEPDAPPPPPDDWHPLPEPTALELLVRGAVGRTWERVRFGGEALRALSSSQRLGVLARRARPAARALLDAARRAQPSTALNPTISPRRHLGAVNRPLEELRQVKRAFGATVNDVLLAVSAGALRRHLDAEEGAAPPLKAMVPVNMRPDEGGGELGNRLSFVFCDLPCDEPDPLRRLRRVQEEVGRRKLEHRPSGGDAILGLVSQAAYPLHRLASGVIASPRTFNLVVSSIPGPPTEMYMAGCRLQEAYPVVPLADRHALSVGMATIGGRAFFGLYADRERLPDVDSLAAGFETELDQLLELAEPGAPPSEPARSERTTARAR